MTLVVVAHVVGEARQADAGGITRTPLDVLLHELEQEIGLLGLQFLGHALGAMTDHDHDPVDRTIGQGIEDVPQHRLATQQMEGLRPRRPHADSLAGGEHDRRQASIGHGHRSSTPEATDLVHCARLVTLVIG